MQYTLHQTVQMAISEISTHKKISKSEVDLDIIVPYVCVIVIQAFANLK